ncbi:MAG: UvrD-helicase domain-containing protein [Granulosicoccus sp.]
MSQPVDHEVRKLALDPHQSFIVQAPAGSGKTELLTRRVLTLLCEVDEPEEILAITFTRKAASEMRQRVVETLQQAMSDSGSTDPYVLEGQVLARKVLARDEQLDWQLLRNPQRLNLRTIDSLATQLAHRLPVTSTLGAPTGLVESADALYQEAARRFIETHLDSLDLVLLHLGNKLDRAQQLLAGLLAKRDQWKRHVYNAGDDHDALRVVLEGMLAELVESRLDNLCALVPEGFGEKLVPCLLRAAEYALTQAEGDMDELCWEMQLWHSMSALPGSDIGELNNWASICFAVLTTSNNQPRKRLTNKEGFPRKVDAKKLGVSAADLDLHKQSMVDAIGCVAESSEFLDALVEVRKLPLPVYKDEQWALLSQLLTVLPQLLLELQLVFAEQAVVDFGEISARAALALGTEDAPTDLALSMDLSLKHLLVDEFQDTSQTQFQLFEQLVRPWGAGDARTFFAVGDPMQSIYRFREGDVALFGRVQEQGIGPVQVKPLTLSVNFRAAPAVTHWVNETFSAIFPQRADSDTGAVPYSSSVAHQTYEGRVAVHPLIDCDKVDEAKCVAQLCAQSIDGDAEHKVAILVRSRAQAVEIFSALREYKLAYESIDMDLVGDRPVVRDLIALTLALRYPHDRLHWLALLRAPFVGLSLNDLHDLMNEAESQAAVIERLQDEAVVSRLSEDAQQRIKRLLMVIEPAMSRGMRGRLMPWVESVWLQLGGPVVCDSQMDQDAANRAIALLYQLEARGDLWQKSTIEAAMAGLYAAAADTHCQIQVMTLHKSKGLEFDTVILPALDRQPRTDSTQLLNWFESTLHGAPQLLLAPFEQTGVHINQRDRINKLVQRAGERCDAQEKLRLLYVACTRAKRYLHLVARASHNVKGELGNPSAASLLAPLWPIVENEFLLTRTDENDNKIEPCNGVTQGQLSLDMGVDEDDEAAAQDEKSTHLEFPPFQRLPLDAQLPAFQPFHWQLKPALRKGDDTSGLEFSWAGRDARDIGTVVHDQLQIIAELPSFDAIPDKQTHQAIIRRQLKNLGLNVSRLDAAAGKVMKALSNTLDDERGCWILKQHDQARSEWALSVPAASSLVGGEAGAAGLTPVQKVVIDRTFVDGDGVRWIIDYKTGDHEGSDKEAFLDQEQLRYTDQLNRYADIIRHLDDRPVKLGLYFPMLKGWREWEAMDS